MVEQNCTKDFFFYYSDGKEYAAKKILPKMAKICVCVYIYMCVCIYIYIYIYKIFFSRKLYFSNKEFSKTLMVPYLYLNGNVNNYRKAETISL